MKILQVFLSSFLGFVAITFVLLGFYDRKNVLDANNCKMTYTSKEKSIVVIDSMVSAHKLWKITNPRGKKLNHQPVLFVPGHFGSVDQARSLASNMHNTNDYFQYYAIDFQGESTAFHGSDILSQAAFVNEALAKVSELHNITLNGVKTSGDKVMIIAHSLGGIVARAAVLLSNHPKCVVSDILMLSAPNFRAPFTPDSSMEVLFSNINKAWLLSFYNTSKPCHTNAIMASLSPRSSDLNKITADYLCPVCAPRIRLTSISGGDVDMHVSPTLSLLSEIASRPRNMSLEVPRQKSVGVLGRVTQMRGAIFKSMYGGVSNAFTAVNGLIRGNSSDSNTTLTNTSVGSEVVDEVCQAENSTCFVVSNETVVEQESTIPVDPILNNTQSQTQYSFITKDNWAHHIMPYIEPQFLSVRTSQLKEVGFPIDHTAVLWCYQLLQVVTRGLTQLSKVDVETVVDLSEIFPVTRDETADSAVDAVKSINIDQLSRFVSRNQSTHAYNTANVAEFKYIQNILGGSVLRSLPVTYVTSHLVKIPICYLVLSCLTVAGMILRALGGHTASSPVGTISSFELLLPWNHLTLDVLYPALVNIVKQFGVPAAAISSLLALCSRAGTVALISKVLYDWVFSPVFSRTYSEYLFWIVSYGAALVLRFILLVLIFVIQYVSNTVYTVVRSILRLTIWNQFVRRSYRKVSKSIWSWAMKVPVLSTVISVLRSSSIMLVVVSVWIAIYLKTSDRIAGDIVALGRGTFGLSLVSIVGYIGMTVVLLIALLCNPYDSKKDRQLHHYFTECVLLYLPAPILAYPSFLFAAKLLYAPPLGQFHTVSALYGIFGPERIHYCLCLMVVAFHLWTARDRRHTIESVTALTWLEEILGPRAVLAAQSIDGKNATGDMFSAFRMNSVVASSAACIHEDGGIYAVFEKIDPNTIDAKDQQQVVEVASGVTMGSTYRVVHCACAKNPLLKFQSEWCDWCRCRKCGGKHLPAERQSYSQSDNINDFSASLVLLIAVYGIAVMTVLYVADRPYLYLYFLGLVAVAHIVVRVVKAMKISQ